MKKRFIVVTSVFVGIVSIAAVAYFILVSVGKRSFAGAPETAASQDASARVSEGDTSLSDGSADTSDPVEAAPTETDVPAEEPGAKTTESASKQAAPATDAKDVSGPVVVDRLVSFGYEKRTSRDIDTIVIHSSYDALGSDPYSVSGVIEEYRQSGVSPHYLIDRKGNIYRLVEDRDVAYHAGVSRMSDGRTGVNGFSIGIEVIEKDTDSPTDAQYAALRSLVASLRKRYTSIGNVVGHSDIAPDRKTDPWNFDWKRMK